MTVTPKNALIWCEIPVTNLKNAMAFYSAVFDYEMKYDESGENPIVFLPMADDSSVAGHLYEGKPAKDGTGPTVHLAVPDTVEKAADRCWTAGGSVLGTVIEIPPGRFQYIIDPDGNSVGLFEAAS